MGAGNRGREFFGVVISGVEFLGAIFARCALAQAGGRVKRRMGIALIELLSTSPSTCLAVRGLAARRPLGPEPQARCGS